MFDEKQLHQKKRHENQWQAIFDRAIAQASPPPMQASAPEPPTFPPKTTTPLGRSLIRQINNRIDHAMGTKKTPVSGQ